MPHGPVAASDRYRGTSKGGLYGDTVETIDWSTGQILDTIAELELDEQTTERIPAVSAKVRKCRVCMA